MLQNLVAILLQQESGHFTKFVFGKKWLQQVTPSNTTNIFYQCFCLCLDLLLSTVINSEP